jgi:hypothetical protein
VDGSQLTNLPAPAGTLLAANNLSDVANASTARTNLGLAIGSDVQAYDAGLADIASIPTTDGVFIVGNGTNFVAEIGSTARTSLGLGTAAVEDVGTTAGDIVQLDGSARLPAVDGSQLTNLPGGGGGSRTSPTSITTTTTLSAPAASTLEEIYYIDSGSAVTVTLVAASTVDGFKYNLKRLGAGAVTIALNGSDVIDHSGQTSFSLANQYDSITLVSDGTNNRWLII